LSSQFFSIIVPRNILNILTFITLSKPIVMKKNILSLLSIIIISFRASAQTPVNSKYCGSTIKFEVTGTGSYQWYNTATGGSSLGTGNSIVVSENDATLKSSSPETVYSLFAEGTTTSKSTIGFSSTQNYGTPISGTLGSNKLRIAFTTTKAITIDSITIKIASNLSCGTNQNPKVTLAVYSPTDLNFTTITKTITFACKGTGSGLYKIPVAIELATAGDYALKVNTATSPNNYLMEYIDPTTSFYPVGNSVISFTGDDDANSATNLIPGLYDWVVSTKDGIGSRVEVTATNSTITKPNVASQSKTITSSDPAPLLIAPSLKPEETGLWSSQFAPATISQNGQTADLAIGNNQFFYLISSTSFNCGPIEEAVNILVENPNGLSNEDLNKNGYALYPNPFKSEFTLSNSNQEKATAKIMDLNGIVLEERILKNASESLGLQLLSGTYILQISTPNESRATRIVKQ